jgi:hypothetical protein
MIELKTKALQVASLKRFPRRCHMALPVLPLLSGCGQVGEAEKLMASDDCRWGFGGYRSRRTTSCILRSAGDVYTCRSVTPLGREI